MKSAKTMQQNAALTCQNGRDGLKPLPLNLMIWYIISVSQCCIALGSANLTFTQHTSYIISTFTEHTSCIIHYFCMMQKNTRWFSWNHGCDSNTMMGPMALMLWLDWVA
jgi:hypothetical protein